jgi:hypothetical protein
MSTIDKKKLAKNSVSEIEALYAQPKQIAQKISIPLTATRYYLKRYRTMRQRYDPIK